MLMFLIFTSCLSIGCGAAVTCSLCFCCRDVEVSITDSYYPGDSHRTKCEEGARQRIAPFSIERKSVTFVDSGTNGAQLEKWWGTN